MQHQPNSPLFDGLFAYLNNALSAATAHLHRLAEARPDHMTAQAAVDQAISAALRQGGIGGPNENASRAPD